MIDFEKTIKYKYKEEIGFFFEDIIKYIVEKLSVQGNFTLDNSFTSAYQIMSADYKFVDWTDYRKKENNINVLPWGKQYHIKGESHTTTVFDVKVNSGVFFLNAKVKGDLSGGYIGIGFVVKSEMTDGWTGYVPGSYFFASYHGPSHEICCHFHSNTTKQHIVHETHCPFMEGEVISAVLDANSRTIKLMRNYQETGIMIEGVPLGLSPAVCVYSDQEMSIIISKWSKDRYSQLTTDWQKIVFTLFLVQYRLKKDKIFVDKAIFHNIIGMAMFSHYF
eukprot:TRINITY_DN5912_c0_g1_i1.p1 TRINITY_DN5912_c0_g1~~TRINITY_DN5912_c0_g1_i1.p1  ORF type:complete len:277 (+),score=39.61 TRINITY_DN5912_c0_g1_i1:362-1192(+)